MITSMDRDIEKAPTVDGMPLDNTSDGAVRGESFEYGNSLYAKIQRVAGKLNIEQRGIERVPADEQTDTSYFNIGSMVSFLPGFCWSIPRLSTDRAL